MDYKETAKILAIIKVAYPTYYNGMSAEDVNSAINLWQGILGEYPYQAVEGVVKAYISQDNEFPPTVGKINTLLKRMAGPERMTPLQAWALVMKAVDSSEHCKSFDELPIDIQEVIGDYKQLKQWALIDNPATWNVVASNFQKSYAMHEERKKETEAIPQVTRDLLSNLKMLKGE